MAPPPKDISEAAKPMFDRFSDALKVLGGGNGAGLVGMVTAMHSIDVGHPHSAILLKPTAVIFAIGVFLFAAAYTMLIYAYIYMEHYRGLLDQAALGNPIGTAPEKPKAASVYYMRLAVICGLASTFAFFVGFVVASVALIRY